MVNAPEVDTGRFIIVSKSEGVKFTSANIPNRMLYFGGQDFWHGTEPFDLTGISDDLKTYRKRDIIQFGFFIPPRKGSWKNPVDN